MVQPQPGESSGQALNCRNSTEKPNVVVGCHRRRRYFMLNTLGATVKRRMEGRFFDEDVPTLW
jgi:hypothetical protein